MDVHVNWDINPTTIITFATVVVGQIIWQLDTRNKAVEAGKKADKACTDCSGLSTAHKEHVDKLEERFNKRDETNVKRVEEIAELLIKMREEFLASGVKLKEDFHLSVTSLKEAFGLYRENMAERYVTQTTLRDLESRLVEAQKQTEIRTQKTLTQILARLDGVPGRHLTFSGEEG
jgi:hypothetical protein